MLSRPACAPLARGQKERFLTAVPIHRFVVLGDFWRAKYGHFSRAPKRDMVITDLDQLCVADITYIRLREEFVFLAVIPDFCSRRVIGWGLDRTLSDELTLTALRMALARRTVHPGLYCWSTPPAWPSRAMLGC